MQFRPDPGFTAITAFFLALLIGLGVWQLQRREWKLDLIAETEAQLAADPAALTLLLDLWPPEELEYRPVTLQGTPLPENRVRLFEPLEGTPGTWQFVPLRLADGSGRSVFVNFGFVPEGMTAPPLPEGAITVEGVVRLPSTNRFAPDPDPARDLWYGRDVVSMAAAQKLTSALPLYVIRRDGAEARPGAQSGSQSQPQPRQGQVPILQAARPDLPNNHLNYALTWFSLALCVVAMYAAFHVRQGRLRF